MNFSWIIKGKLAGHRGPSSEKELAWLKKQGILSLIRMAEENKTTVSSSQTDQLGLWDCHLPVPDFTAPAVLQVEAMVEFINKSLAADRPVGVSCGAGKGRTGTILACYLVSKGFSAEEAINEVRARRPGSIETEGQEAAVEAYAKTVRHGNDPFPLHSRLS